MPSDPQSLRGGVYDVIPEGALAPLSPEDLRLILCGSHAIDTERLRLITVFEDESSESISFCFPSSSVPPGRERGGGFDEVQGLVLVCGGEDEYEREAGAALFLDQQSGIASQHGVLPAISQHHHQTSR